MTQDVLDAQTLALLGTETLRINNRVYEAQYPNWDFSRLIYVNTSGPEWSGGTITFSMDYAGEAKLQSAGADDVPMVAVSQDYQTRKNLEYAVGYDWHEGEVQRLSAVPAEISNVVERRARAARNVAQKKLYDITLLGEAQVGLGGLINYTGIPTTTAPADGAGGVTFWVDDDGVGTKTPAQIVRDINAALQGVWLATSEIVLADTILLPVEAYNYIAATPYSAVTMETILSFVQRTNIYTLQTGRPLTIRTVSELGTAGGSSTGRMVAYFNAQDYVQLHLPMPFRFHPIWRAGPFRHKVPGLFRTGGVEFLTTSAARYVDGISEPPAA